MNQKNTGGIGAAALDLGLGDQLAVQVNAQVDDQKKRDRKTEAVTSQMGAAQDILGSGMGGLGG